MQAQAAISRQTSWQCALDEALSQTSALVTEAGGADLVFLFASAAFAEDFPALIREAQRATRARVLVGCSGQGIIGADREIEGEPALSLLTLHLPGATVQGARLTQQTIERCPEPDDWRRALGIEPGDVNGWLVFVDPFRIDPEAMIGGIAAAYPGRPLIGGLASGDQRAQRTHVFLDDRVYDEGAVAVALGGAYTLHTVVSQGAEPIGEPWTITGAQGHLVETISQRPALEVLMSTLEALPPEEQHRAQRNLLVGLAMDERRIEFRRGDFLIRNLVGVDRNSGALAVGAFPRVGQTIQFQIRDARAADEDLRTLLTQARARLGDQRPLAALLCSCNGRGQGLFGTPDHDARLLVDQLGVNDVAGFFCNGEIGPVGPRVFLHGYTASIALIVPTNPTARPPGE